MKSPNKIFVDFNNADKHGRVRLNTIGTFRDIEKNKIELIQGLEIILDDNDGLQTIGIIEFSIEENIWVAKINWNNI